MARTKTKTEVISTAPFDVKGWIQKEEQVHPGFAAAVEAELASLRLDERLRELRKSRALTQTELAKRMGVSQGAVAQMEKSEPGTLAVRTIAKMATAMGYSIRIDFEPRSAPMLPDGSTVVFKKNKPIEVHTPEGTVSIHSAGRLKAIDQVAVHGGVIASRRSSRHVVRRAAAKK